MFRQNSSTSNLLNLIEISDEATLPLPNSTNARLQRQIQEKKKKLSLLRKQLNEVDHQSKHFGERNEKLRKETQEIEQESKMMSKKFEESNATYKQFEIELSSVQKQLRDRKTEVENALQRKDQYETACRRQKEKLEEEEGREKQDVENLNAYQDLIKKKEQLGGTIQSYAAKDEKTTAELALHLKTLRDQLAEKKRLLRHISGGDSSRSNLSTKSADSIKSSELDRIVAKIDHGRLQQKQQEKSKIVTVLENSVSQLETEVGTLEKAKSKFGDEKQDLYVQAQLLKSEVRRLTDLLEEKENQVIQEGRQKEENSLELRTHEEEAKTIKDLLQAECCQLMEERRKLAQQLRDVETQTQRLNNRLETLKLDGKEDIIAQNAKKRKELKATSQELDKKINKADREMLALRKTFDVVNTRNRTLREGLSVVDERNEEFQEKIKFEKERQQIQNECIENREKIADLEKNYQLLNEELKDVNEQLKKFDSSSMKKSATCEHLRVEIAQQETKLARWDKLIKKTVQYSGLPTSLAQAYVDFEEYQILNQIAEKIVADAQSANSETSLTD